MNNKIQLLKKIHIKGVQLRVPSKRDIFWSKKMKEIHLD